MKSRDYDFFTSDMTFLPPLLNQFNQVRLFVADTIVTVKKTVCIGSSSLLSDNKTPPLSFHLFLLYVPYAPPIIKINVLLLCTSGTYVEAIITFFISVPLA